MMFETHRFIVAAFRRQRHSSRAPDAAESAHVRGDGAFAIWLEPFVREMAEVTRAHARTYTEPTRYYDTRTACVAR